MIFWTINFLRLWEIIVQIYESPNFSMVKILGCWVGEKNKKIDDLNEFFLFIYGENEWFDGNKEIFL